MWHRSSAIIALFFSIASVPIVSKAAPSTNLPRKIIDSIDPALSDPPKNPTTSLRCPNNRFIVGFNSSSLVQNAGAFSSQATAAQMRASALAAAQCDITKDLDEISAAACRTSSSTFNRSAIDSNFPGAINYLHCDLPIQSFQVTREPGSGQMQGLSAQSILEPNDQYYGWQWGLTNARLPNIWPMEQGDLSSVIAVLDSGIDQYHPDLSSNLWTNPGEIPNNNIDDDGNGYIDDVHGANPHWGNGNIQDVISPRHDSSHGTMISGILGARGNNSIGIAGVNWLTSIMPVKVLDNTTTEDLNVYLSDLLAGMNYISMMKGRGTNIRVANASLGFKNFSLDYNGNPTYSSDCPGAMAAGIQSLANAGVLLVTAAGNDGTDLDSCSPSDPESCVFPANCQAANQIVVAGSNSNNQIACDGDTNINCSDDYSSNYGTQIVDLAAPSTLIHTTFPNNAYVEPSGTSAAAPFVSGVANLLFRKNPSLSPSNVKSILKSSLAAVASPPTSSPRFAPGRLDAELAWNNTPYPSGVVSGQVLDRGVGLSGVTLTLKRTSDGSTVSTRVSDSNGFFSFASVPGGATYYILATKTGYRFTSPSFYLGSGSATVSISSIYPIVAGTITFNGSPLAGVTVNGGVLGNVTTDSTGFYIFRDVYPGTYNFTPSKSGYVFTPTAFSAITITTADRNFNFTAAYGPVSVSGRLVTASGTPISGVGVTLYYWDVPTQSDQAVNGGTSGADGRFTLASTRGAGNYRVTPRDDHYQFSPTSIGATLSPGSSSNLGDFVGTSVYRFFVSVTAADGYTPLCGVTVNGGSLGAFTTYQGSYFCIASGNFYAPLGQAYSITAQAPGRCFSPATVSGTASSDLNIQFTETTCQYNLHGTIVDQEFHEPIAGIAVTDIISGETVYSDAAGSFLFRRPSGFGYILQAANSHYTFSPSQITGVVSGNTEVTFFAQVKSFNIFPPRPPRTYGG